MYATIDTPEIEEEADVVPEPVEKPRSHAPQLKEEPDSRTSSSKSQIESPGRQYLAHITGHTHDLPNPPPRKPLDVTLMVLILSLNYCCVQLA